MSAVKKLQKIQEKNKSLICLGLDLDVKRMPADATTSPRAMFDFAQNVVEATKDLVCAYKPNLAFFENMDGDGLSLLRLIVERIPDDIPVILDGKRGDISNTANHYASALFDRLGADWVTINPYMGYDSMRPFIERKDKGMFVLCLTSNAGSRDFQQLNVEGKPLYMVVAEKISYWNKDNNCGLVVGATHPQQLAEIRKASEGMPLLIPGVGAQGGALEQAVLDGTDNFTQPAVINVSRSVLYASNGKDYAERAREELLKLNQSVNECRKTAEADDVDADQVDQKNKESENKRESNQSQSTSVHVTTGQPNQAKQSEPTPPVQSEPTQPVQAEPTTPDVTTQPAPSEPSTPPESSTPSAPVTQPVQPDQAQPNQEQHRQQSNQHHQQPQKQSGHQSGHGEQQERRDHSGDNRQPGQHGNQQTHQSGQSQSQPSQENKNSHHNHNHNNERRNNDQDDRRD